ncbi:DUF5984 family protein [Micromonospora sp. NBC_01813]|uniref:DUF5984 family protein n=1 Tax=Micromonospora sp. NBC_01813 TaxID=2975988 RepID=UPI002DD8A125|nr:DUF5984 family protein [Micromonospora sp. NBC_01813]WSA07196.1 DUF5984 family protein [Micromonospora sp. NBC_01813]
MISFRFELYPLDEVSPWGSDQPRLHWFGLTEGCYWLEVGGQELLRRIRHVHPHPYIDYYLARLWEDVIVLAPQVLEPVPDDLQSFIASQPAQWACDPLEFVAEPGEERTDDGNADGHDHPVVTAAIWHGEHYLDFGYLRNPPKLRFWRSIRSARDEITVDWQHEDDGEIGFTADPTVRLSVPTAAYLDAVHTLNHQLMAAMGQRVEVLERRSGLPRVDLDLIHLRREHEERRHWLTKNLDRSPQTDWNLVRQGAHLLLGDVRRAATPNGPSIPSTT